MKAVKISVTTDGDGDGTGYGEAIPGSAALWAIEYVPGDIDTGATVTLTDEYAGASFTLWVQASAGTSTIREFPRVLENLNTDGSALTTHTAPVICGRPKVVVASGGATKTGSIIMHLIEI